MRARPTSPYSVVLGLASVPLLAISLAAADVGPPRPLAGQLNGSKRGCRVPSASVNWYSAARSAT
jgi:hypothetical protein